MVDLGRITPGHNYYSFLAPLHVLPDVSELLKSNQTVTAER